MEFLGKWLSICLLLLAVGGWQAVFGQAKFSFERGAYAFPEDTGFVWINLKTQGPAADTFRIEVQTLAGTATPGTDYTQLQQTLTFFPGDSLQTVRLQLRYNPSVTPDLFFLLLLTPLDTLSTVLGNNPVTVTLKDIGPYVAAFGWTDTTLFETSGLVSVPVEISPANSLDTLQYTLAGVDYTAYQDFDYEILTDTLTFLPGQNLAWAQVRILPNTVSQNTISFRLKLRDAGRKAQVGYPDSVVIRIRDDDYVLTAGFRDTAASFFEAIRVAEVPVRLNFPSVQPVSVYYHTAPGAAKSGVDYQTVSYDSVVFSPGDTLKWISVKIVNDLLPEPDEDFYVVLTAATAGCQVGKPDSIRVWITNNDPSAVGSDQVADALSLYPNPCQESFRIDLPGSWVAQPLRLEVLGLDGRLQQEIAETPLHAYWDVSVESLPPGVYLLRLTGEAISWKGKLVKE